VIIAAYDSFYVMISTYVYGIKSIFMYDGTESVAPSDDARRLGTMAAFLVESQRVVKQ
jgi:hypothetical protein